MEAQTGRRISYRITGDSDFEVIKQSDQCGHPLRGGDPDWQSVRHGAASHCSTWWRRCRRG